MTPQTSDNWQAIKRIFQVAAELSKTEQAEYLAQACAVRPEWRATIEQLLLADEAADEFLEQPPLQQWRAATVPTQIGNYRIVRELGRGGMGTVYLGERSDQQFEQQVAIKVIKRELDSTDLLRRFRMERQILAQLNHPHIARLLDGGSTADGLPYYVMEYIDGVPLDEYCQQHDLNIPARLQLFRTICSAVQYAHQHLVIHRDLKPSNILVTSAGEAKLLDFGIAKLLSGTDAKVAETLTQHAPLTPAYASPEQLLNQPLTTASDIYSLGVILYEILTGQRPFADETPHGASTARAQDPIRPSQRLAQAVAHSSRGPSSTNQSAQSSNATRTAASLFKARFPKQLRGDLDNIVLMTLRKDALRRYASVEQLSEDLRRYLAGEPVVARADSLPYRLQKFVARNRALCAAACLLVLALTGGIVMTTRQARIAERERALAQRRFDDVRSLANAFVFQYQDEIAKLPGSTALRERMISDARNYLTRLAADAGNDATLQIELAQAWLKLGDVQGKAYISNLGQTEEAMKCYLQALALAETASRATPNNHAAQRVLATVRQSIAIADTRTGRIQQALPRYAQATADLQQVVNQNPHDLDALRLLASIWQTYGDAQIRDKADPQRTQTALKTYERAASFSNQLLQAAPLERRYWRSQAVIQQRLGVTYGQLGPGNLHNAVEHHRRSTEYFEKVAQSDAQNLQAQRDLVDQYVMKADVQALAGDPKGALADCQKGVELFTRISQADSQNAEAKRDLATVHYVSASVLQSQKRWAEAASAMRQALAIYEQLTQLDPHNAENLQDMLSGYGRLMECERNLGNLSASAAAKRQMQLLKTRLETSNKPQ